MPGHRDRFHDLVGTSSGTALHTAGLQDESGNSAPIFNIHNNRDPRWTTFRTLRRHHPVRLLPARLDTHSTSGVARRLCGAVVVQHAFGPSAQLVLSHPRRNLLRVVEVIASLLRVPARRVQRVAPSGTLEDACLGLHLWIGSNLLGSHWLECSGAGLFGVSMCCRNTWGVVSSSSWIFTLVYLALSY
jgi:hypothetical protein